MAPQFADRIKRYACTAFLLVYYISVALGRGKKPALQLAMDVTTVFLLFRFGAV